MRQRGTASNGTSEHGETVGTGRTFLRKFDVYSKVHEDYTVQTRSGGLVSLFSLIMMVLLFVTELREHLQPELSDHIIVDTTLDEKLPIILDVTFPHLRCDEISVDSVDSMGENHVDIKGSLQKVNLDAQGKVSQGDFLAQPGDCLSCMEAAEHTPDQCCNSCQELKSAYQEAGLPYFHVLDTAKQCRESVGCQIIGDVRVAKVGGNIHVALGKSTVHEGKHVHEFDIKDVSDGFNTTHSISKLKFGPEVHGMVSPLEGVTKVVKEGAFMFHYYIKLVPTLFSVEGEESVYTHQYAVTDNEKNVLLKKGELVGLPGVFFVYEFSPFMVQKVEKFQPLSHFLTSLCAIIGGVFTVAGLVDAFLYKSVTAVRSAE